MFTMEQVILIALQSLVLDSLADARLSADKERYCDLKIRRKYPKRDDGSVVKALAVHV